MKRFFFFSSSLQVGRNGSNSTDVGPSSSDSPPPPPPAIMMETWVLIPAELSLVLQQHVQHQARVWTRVPVAQGRRWSPFQGTVRLGVMPSIGSTIDALDSEVRKPLKYLFYL